MRTKTPAFQFVIYPDRKGEFRWRLVARNGRIVADSGEGYTTKGHAARAARRLRDAAFVGGSWDFEIVETKPRAKIAK